MIADPGGVDLDPTQDLTAMKNSESDPNLEKKKHSDPTGSATTAKTHFHIKFMDHSPKTTFLIQYVLSIFESNISYNMYGKKLHFVVFQTSNGVLFISIYFILICICNIKSVNHISLHFPSFINAVSMNSKKMK